MINEQLLKESIEFAKTEFLRKKSFDPMFVANTVTGKRFVILGLWEDEKQKQNIVQYVRLLFLAEGVFEYVFMTEMWFKQFEPNERPKGYIADEPDKREGLMCLCAKLETGKIEVKVKILETVRVPEFNLIESDFMKEGEFSGTFAELLSVKKPTAEEMAQIKFLLGEWPKYHRMKPPERRDLH